MTAKKKSVRAKGKYRDRIVGLERIPASKIKDHPKNWRTHPSHQREALRKSLEKIGIADAVLARKLKDGTYQLVDGHLRREELGDQPIPVLVLDVNDDEANGLLLTLDPLAGLAGTDESILEDLRAHSTVAIDILNAMASAAAPAEDLAGTKTGSGSGEGSSVGSGSFAILIECESEAEQHTLLERFLGEGIECRALVS